MTYIAAPNDRISPHVDDLMGASPRLRRFKPSEVVLNVDEARAVLRFFFGARLPETITIADRGFAQALFLEAVDESAKFGVMRSVFKSFFLKPPGLPSRTILKLLKIAAEYAWIRSRPRTLADAQIFEAVRKVIAWKHRSTWETRLNIGRY